MAPRRRADDNTHDALPPRSLPSITLGAVVLAWLPVVTMILTVGITIGIAKQSLAAMEKVPERLEAVQQQLTLVAQDVAVLKSENINTKAEAERLVKAQERLTQALYDLTKEMRR